MDVACCIFDDMTVLDFVGAYHPLTRLEELSGQVTVDICARNEPVVADGLSLGADTIDPDLRAYDLVLVPGGQGTRELRHDEAFLAWLRTAGECQYLASVCTGSLLLGAAGFLDGKRATTHPGAVDLLAEYADAVDDRVVQDGRVITGGGVSAALDIGLYLVELLSDSGTRSEIAARMDYPYGREVFDGPLGPAPSDR